MRIIYPFLYIGIGLVLATTNSYAKSNHSTSIKQAHVFSKKPRTNPKNTLGVKKKKNLHTLLISKNHKTNLLTHALSESHIEPSLPNSTENTHLFSKNLDTQYLHQTAGNIRIHSLIASQKNNFINDSSEETAHHHFFSAHGIVNSSLTIAAQQAGLSNELIVQLTNIFAWDIDFATNLQNGDQFTVVYEKTNTTTDQIVAAEFVTRGKTFTAIRYEDNEGQVNYYSPEGKPMRKAFLSTPVDFIRISSGYDIHRKHPVLNRIRAHKGVDYAARTGTPVKAAGDGDVVFLGRKGGYGQVMILKHGEHHETLYAHLSHFKKGLENGDHVNQGDVIGFVGQTGLATGPHLHYEFRVDGVHQNPESLNNQHVELLRDRKLVEFKSQSQYLLAQLYQTKAKNLFAKSGIAPVN
jgi:murein DD-endopeptidase MepM/ murein hydrolase activator NlpD